MSSISNSDSINPLKWVEIVERSAQKSFGSLVYSSNQEVKVSLIDIETIEMQETIENYKEIDKIIEISIETFQQLQGSEKEAYSRNLRLLSRKIGEYTQEGIDYRVASQLNNLKYAIEDEIGEETPEEASLLTPIIALLNTINSTTTIGDIRLAVNDDLNRLFDSDPTSRAFIAEFINIYQNDASLQQPLLSLYSDLIKHHTHLSNENKNVLINQLFLSTVPSIFSMLMETGENNVLFDFLMREMLSEDFLNANPDIRTQIYVFGFSADRYNARWVAREQIRIEDDDLTRQLTQRFSSPELAQAYSARRQHSVLMNRWLDSRMSVSSTLTSNETDVARFKAQWTQAEEEIYELAINDRVTNAHLSFEKICDIHRKLMNGEIENGGQPRSGDEVARCSDGTYVPPSLLPYRLEEFMIWFNAKCDECDRGEADPIFFAFEVKQRFASLHPFPNGNGRISALLMDYVLQRNQIPPPIVDRQQFSTAIFPLDTTPSNFASAYTAFIIGIQRSLTELEIG